MRERPTISERNKNAVPWLWGVSVLLSKKGSRMLSAMKPLVFSTVAGRTWMWICLAACGFLLGERAMADTQDALPKGSVVRVVDDEHGWGLLLNGKPYFINGAGGQQHLQELVEAGGNSIRTWGANHAGEILDRAHVLGLTVTVGIWLGHERHQFDYGDADAVSRQLEEARRFVELYKDHPALLMWGLGNEAEGDGNNPLVWKAINDLARMTKEVDPHHPTMTVIAEIGGEKIENLRRYCPDIDVLGINSYGGMPSLGARVLEAGLDRPYIITEFGPLGQWEVGKTPWGVPIEQNSTQKAGFCAEGYNYSIVGQPGRCLGGYVFNWGTKQEVTPTWYSLFLDDGSSTEMVDVMTRFWTGAWPANRTPSIKNMEVPSVDLNHLKAGSQCRARVDAEDPEGDELDLHWVVQSESADRKSGGDFEQTPPTHPQAILSENGREVVFRAPTQPGGYRLFVYIRDGHGHVATANLPFFVEP